MSGLPGIILPLGITQRHLRIAGSGAAGGGVGLHQLGSRLRHNERTRLSPGEARSFNAAGSDRHDGLALRPVEQAGMIEPQMLSR